MIKITSQESHNFSKYVYQISGVHLDETKGYLLESRLNPLLASYNCKNYDDLLKSAKRDSSKELQEKIIDAVTTNETFFFRDKSPFKILQYKLIPELIDRRQKLYKSKQVPIRILSAACSTGQEVYSIGITLLEEIPFINNFDISILGIDIADEVIAKASYGKYGKFEVERGMPLGMLNKYFNSTGDGWRIQDKVRVLANFKKVNLLDSFSNLGYFDIIFCRNVAIYFKYNDKVKLFKRLARMLEPDGALIVGGSESLTGVAPDFQVNHYIKGIYYTLNNNSQEKSKEVKKFDVHAFNKKAESSPQRKVKRIKRTMKYVSSGVETTQSKSQKTKNTLERLKQKRLHMEKRSEELRNYKTDDKIEDDPTKIATNAIVEKEISRPIKEENRNKTLNSRLQTQYNNESSLLGTISTKRQEHNPLVFAKEKSVAKNSLLSNISTH